MNPGCTIEFTHDDCEFETADGLMLGGPWLSIEIASDGDEFKIESVRNQGFPALGKPASAAPAYVCDFIQKWLADDLAKPSDKSIVREAYDAAVERERDFAAATWADAQRDERRSMGAW